MGLIEQRIVGVVLSRAVDDFEGTLGLSSWYCNCNENVAFVFGPAKLQEGKAEVSFAIHELGDGFSPVTSMCMYCKTVVLYHCTKLISFTDR